MKLNSKYSTTKILETLSKAEFSHIKQNGYLFDCYDEVLKTMGTVLEIDFSEKVLSFE